MKTLLLFLTLLITIGSDISYSQSGWTWQNPTVNGNDLRSIDMVNVNTGFAAGNAGTILKTTNGGASWNTMNTGTSTHLYSVNFVDINIGYASGPNGFILKTVDGGNSWDSLNAVTTSRLYNIEFLNTNTGFAAGESGTIIRTTDAGATWVELTTPNQTSLFAMDFVDENTGYASGNLAFVFKTTDGGDNWTLASTMPGGYAVWSLCFVNADTGFASNDLAEVLKTTDGGVTWTVSELDDQYYPSLHSLYFVDDNTGYVAGGEEQFIGFAYLYKTTNAGANWTKQIFQDGYLTSVNFVNANTGLSVGLGGEVYKTTNGGTNWNSLKHSVTDYTLSAVHFPTLDTGYAVSYGTVIKTSNAGLNWVALTHPAPSNQCDGVFFINGTTGVIGGEFNNIWRTSDGGQSWTAVQPDNFSLYHEFEFTDDNTGYAAGAQGKISKTTDGGLTWFGQNATSTTWDFRDIKFVNENTGVAVGIQKLMVKTTNGGVNWISKTHPATSNFAGVDFYGDTGIAVTSNFAQIIRTTDLGETWSTIASPVTIGLTSVELISPTVGYITGWSGTILKTTDAGLTWVKIPSSTASHVEDIYFASENSAYAVGGGGMVLHMDNPGTFVRGSIKYEDNGQTVSSGRVMALKLNRETNEVVVLGSSTIKPNGDYAIPNLPPDTVMIVAYPNSDLDFVPTYYPSTIDWENAITINPQGTLTNINVNVFRISSTSSAGSIEGGVFQGARIDSNIIDYAIVYAKLNGQFKSFSTSISNGDYNINNLPNGTYEIHASRLGYAPEIFQVTLNNGTMDSVNIFMSPLITGITQNGNTVPDGFELKQNYPNPFNPTTNIQYSIPKGSIVKLYIYDITGRKMASLVNTFQNAGKYTINFDGSSLSSGVYFYTIESNDFRATKKMLLLK